MPKVPAILASYLVILNVYSSFFGSNEEKRTGREATTEPESAWPENDGWELHPAFLAQKNDHFNILSSPESWNRSRQNHPTLFARSTRYSVFNINSWKYIYSTEQGQEAFKDFLAAPSKGVWRITMTTVCREEGPAQTTWGPSQLHGSCAGPCYFLPTLHVVCVWSIYIKLYLYKSAR